MRGTRRLRPCLHRTARRRSSPADAGRFVIARISIRAARLIEPGEESAMTTRIRDFLRNRRENHQDDGPCLVVDLDVVRENYLNLRQGAARHARVLRREGQSGAGGAVAPGRARLLLRHRLGPRDRDGARRRRHRRPHLLWQHHQEGARHRARLRARRAPVRGRLPGRGREDRARRAGRPRVLPHPLRLRRRGVAAVAQVRLRAGDGGRRAGSTRTGSASSLTASRSTSVRSSAIRMPGTARSPPRPRCSAIAASAA